MADKAKWTYEVLTKKRYYCRNTSDKTDESCGRMVIVISNISSYNFLCAIWRKNRNVSNFLSKSTGNEAIVMFYRGKDHVLQKEFKDL